MRLLVMRENDAPQKLKIDWSTAALGSLRFQTRTTTAKEISVNFEHHSWSVNG